MAESATSAINNIVIGCNYFKGNFPKLSQKLIWKNAVPLYSSKDTLCVEVGRSGSPTER
jgi:allantoicase